MVTPKLMPSWKLTETVAASVRGTSLPAAAIVAVFGGCTLVPARYSASEQVAVGTTPSGLVATNVGMVQAPAVTSLFCHINLPMTRYGLLGKRHLTAALRDV